MSNVLYQIPIYKINGIDARIGGEWPGKLPCHFKSSKCIIKPPNHDIFSGYGSPAEILRRPMRRYLPRELSKEYVFRSSSKSVPPIKKMERAQSLKIFPNSYQHNFNICDVNTSIPKVQEDNELYIQNKIRLCSNIKPSNAEMKEIITGEMRLIRENANYEKIFKSLSNKDLLKKNLNKSHLDSMNKFFQNENQIDGNSQSNNKSILDLHKYIEKTTNLFDSKLPKIQK